MHYYSLAIVSGLFFILLDILYKYTSCSRLPVELFVSLWYIMGGFISLTYFITKNFYKESIKINNLFIISFISLLTFTGNIIYFKSSKKSPNPGLSRALFSGFLILGLTLTSYLFFNGNLNLKKMLGVIFIVFGIQFIIVN
jgi:multidrug transporter EmrE-like cation transporter